MKKLFIILYLLTNIFVLGACGDVERPTTTCTESRSGI